jgi:hypothetical protein
MDTPQTEPDGHVRELLHRISGDVKTIARGEVELVRDELKATARAAAVDVGAALFGGIVALIGLAMLCAVMVAALAPVIHPLWARLLVMAVVYLAIGGGVVAGFAHRLKRDAVPRLAVAKYEGKSTVNGVKATLVQEGR